MEVKQVYDFKKTNYSGFIEHHDRAIEFYHDDDDSLLSIYEQYLTGLMYYVKDKEKIIDVFKDFTTHYRRVQGSEESNSVISFTYHFIAGGVTYAINDFSATETYSLKAIQIFDQLDDTLISNYLADQYVKTYFNLCGSYLDIGKYEEAIQATRYLLSWTNNYFGEDHPYWNLVVFNAYAAVKSHDYKAAFDGFLIFYNKYISDNNDRQTELINLMLTLADLSIRLDDEKTYRYYMNRVKSLVKTSSEKSYYQYNQANYWLRRDTIKAIGHFNRGIKEHHNIAPNEKVDLQLIEMHEILADIFFVQKNLSKSKVHSRRIIELSFKENKEQDQIKKDGIDKPNEKLISAYSSLLKIAIIENNIKEAKEYADQLLKAIVEIKNDDYFLNDKIRFFKTTYDYFGQLIGFYHSQNDMNKIFDLMRKSKAQIIKESIVKRKHINFGSLAEEKHIADLKVRLSDSNMLKAESLDLKNRIYKLQENINYQTSSQVKASLNKENFKPNLSLLEFQKSLERKSLVMEYYLGGEDSYCMIIDREQATLIRIESDSNIEESVLQYITTIKSKKVISPTLKQVQDQVWPGNVSVDQYDKLIIIPDGVLHYLPFELFRLDNDPFIDHVSISYQLYSDMVLAAQTAKREFDNKMLAIAPSFQYKPGSNVNSEFENLLFNKAEVYGISSYFEADILTDTTATKEIFLSRYTNHSILHFSTHAQIRDDSEKSFIAFSDNSSDHKLYQHQIENLDFSADMVVLSACETGIGEVLKGESMFSLKRAFFQSGCQSVVSSLWSVNDQCTAEIMTSFYKYLHQGMQKDEALREAKLDYLSVADPEFQHPYYWAGFTIVGDTSPIHSAVWVTKYYVIGLLGLTFLFLGIKYFRGPQLS